MHSATTWCNTCLTFRKRLASWSVIKHCPARYRSERGFCFAPSCDPEPSRADVHVRRCGIIELSTLIRVVTVGACFPHLLSADWSDGGEAAHRVWPGSGFVRCLFLNDGVLVVVSSMPAVGGSGQPILSPYCVRRSRRGCLWGCEVARCCGSPDIRFTFLGSGWLCSVRHNRSGADPGFGGALFSSDKGQVHTARCLI